MHWEPKVPLPCGIGREGGPAPLGLRPSPRDILEPENAEMGAALKRLFSIRRIAYLCGTGGDADGRSRRSPLSAILDRGRTRILWLLNILAEGIKTLLVCGRI